MKKKKRKSSIRILRNVGILLILFLSYSAIGAYLPFVRCPSIEDTTAIEKRADTMQTDTNTGDRVMLLATHEDALDERIRLMNLAKRELIIATYDCRDGQSTRDLMSVALERANAGVRVRLLVDGISGWMSLSFNPMFQALEAHDNIEIRFYNPVHILLPWHHMGRMHDKYVIVDDTAFILGGRNMFDSFIGTYPVDKMKDDREVLVYNAGEHGHRYTESSVVQLQKYFEEIWNSDWINRFPYRRTDGSRINETYRMLESRCEVLKQKRPQLFAGADYSSMTVPTKGIWLIANPIGIYVKEPVVFSQLCALMKRARSEVIIQSPYAVLNEYMLNVLSEISSAVPVTLMVNSIENSHNIAGSSDYIIHRDDILSTGVNLLEYSGKNYHHGKAVLIDDSLSVIGCYNLDLRSTYVDTELMLVIRSREMNEMLRENMGMLLSECTRVQDKSDQENLNEALSPPLPLIKSIALRVLGTAVQLVRNLL